VTWATSAAYKYVRSKRDLDTARRRARNVILEEIREKDYQNVKKTYAEKVRPSHDRPLPQAGSVKGDRVSARGGGKALACPRMREVGARA
jgi:hypothetical protein